jgi:ABC-type phosphate transport system auxiliary subunit
MPSDTPSAKQAPQTAQTAGSFVEPKISTIRISGKLTGTLDDISAKVSTIDILPVKKYPDKVVIARIESRDIQKRPFLFIIITINTDSVVVEYSIAPDTSEKLRRMAVLEMLLNVLSMISGSYSIDNKELFQNLETSMDEVMNSITQNYSVLFNKYDSLFTEYRDLKRLNIELTAANRDLNVKTFQLDKENNELKDRLKTLEVYNEDELMVMVQEWLDSHSSTIDLGEFAKTYKLQMPRVEQILNKMQSLGYIEIKG